MNDSTHIMQVVALLQKKHARPENALARDVYAAIAPFAALAGQPVVFELCRVVDSLLTFLHEEIGRTRDVGEYLEQLATLVQFQELVAAGYDPAEGNGSDGETS